MLIPENIYTHTSVHLYNRHAEINGTTLGEQLLIHVNICRIRVLLLL